jgi:hypothetical protein
MIAAQTQHRELHRHGIRVAHIPWEGDSPMQKGIFCSNVAVALAKRRVAQMSQFLRRGREFHRCDVTVALSERKIGLKLKLH